MLKDGVLVIVESTVAPGTTEGLVGPLLEEASGKKLNEGFFLGTCPQRVMPGRLLKNLRELSRVCGGTSPETARAIAALYGTVVQGRLDPSDCVTAEIVKTAENTYRDVKIAFANELGLICESAGADVGGFRELLHDSGGGDLPLRRCRRGRALHSRRIPWLLVAGAEGFEPRLIAAARAINLSMPQHMASLVEDALAEANVPLAGARVAVLGFAYLQNTGDTRNSPSESFIAHLRAKHADVVVHDPWVAEHAGDLWERVAGAHAVVIMVSHDEYLDLDLDRLARTLRSPVLVDGRHVVETEAAQREGSSFVDWAAAAPPNRRGLTCDDPVSLAHRSRPQPSSPRCSRRSRRSSTRKGLRTGPRWRRSRSSSRATSG